MADKAVNRICVIFNPIAKGEGARRFREHLEALGDTCVRKPTQCAGDARRLGAEAAREGFDTIVAAGGDGTINEVVNGIGDENAFARARFGVLPLGTVNVFARELRIPAQFDAAWDIIRHGSEIQLDLGQTDFTQNNRPARRYFVQMAGAGYDAQAITLANWEYKKRIGVLAYFIAGLQALCRKQPPIHVECGAEKFPAQLVLVGNGRFYAGSFALFPRADLQDGLLEVTAFPKIGVTQLLRLGCGLLFNRLYTWGGARHLQVKELRLSSAEPVPFHVEGENTGALPVQFSVRPRALRILVNNATI
jgi:diacylglycerol kinase (ATP)